LSIICHQAVFGQISAQVAHSSGTRGMNLHDSPPIIVENRVGQIGDLFDPAASKGGIDLRQSANRALARPAGIAIADEPVIETIGDQPQQRHGQKLVMNSGKQRT